MGSKRNLNLVGVPDELKIRLRVEAIKRRTSPSKLVISILDAALPKLEETDNKNSQSNGHAQTLREQFERAQSYH